MKVQVMPIRQRSGKSFRREGIDDMDEMIHDGLRVVKS